MASIDKIERDVQGLSESDKSRLLRLLVADMDGESEQDVERAWLEEARRRDAELEQGTVEARPLDEVIERVRKRLGYEN